MPRCEPPPVAHWRPPQSFLRTAASAKWVAPELAHWQTRWLDARRDRGRVLTAKFSTRPSPRSLIDRPPAGTAPRLTSRHPDPRQPQILPNPKAPTSGLPPNRPLHHHHDLRQMEPPPDELQQTCLSRSSAPMPLPRKPHPVKPPDSGPLEKYLLHRAAWGARSRKAQKRAPFPTSSRSLPRWAVNVPRTAARDNPGTSDN